LPIIVKDVPIFASKHMDREIVSILKSKIYIPITISIVAALLSTSYLSNLSEKKRNEYESRLISNQEINYQSVVKHYMSVSEIYYNLYINQPEIVSIFARTWQAADDTLSVVRKELFKALESTYKVLTSYELRQLHYHLPDSRSFLRFHSPESYGDTLSFIRPSISRVYNEGKPLYGFEEGRVINGFRNIYPVQYKENRIGTVEISFNFNALRNQITTTFPGDYAFIVRNELVQSRVWEQNQSAYKESDLDPAFLYESVYQPQDFIARINASIKKDIKTKLESGTSFVIPAEAGDSGIAVVFLPVKNIEGKHAAYIISYFPDNTFKSIYREQFIGSVWTGSLSIIIAILLHIWYSYYRLLLRQKENLEKSKKELNLIDKHLEVQTRRLSNILEGTGAGTWEWNLEKDEIKVNENWAAIIGYTREELGMINKAWWNLNAYPGDAAMADKSLERHFKGETSIYDVEVRLKHKNGDWVWINSRGKVISRTPEGRPHMMFGTHVTIDNRKQVEQ